MLTENEISQRNGYLINFISALDLGIHVLDLPHKPKLISPDYTRWLSGFVRNFTLILTTGEFSKETYFEIKLKPVEKMNPEEHKQKILYWLTNIEHKRVYTLSSKACKLFVVGFNHHNKILKKNPFPVFGQFYPLLYYDLSRAIEVRNRFSQYDLYINGLHNEEL